MSRLVLSWRIHSRQAKEIKAEELDGVVGKDRRHGPGGRHEYTRLARDCLPRSTLGTEGIRRHCGDFELVLSIAQ